MSGKAESFAHQGLPKRYFRATKKMRVLVGGGLHRHDTHCRLRARIVCSEVQFSGNAVTFAQQGLSRRRCFRAIVTTLAVVCDKLKEHTSEIHPVQNHGARASLRWAALTLRVIT